MPAQAGLDAAAGARSALAFLWLAAAGYLLFLMSCSALIAGVRAWNRRTGRAAKDFENSQGESRTPKPARGTAF